VNRLLGRLGRLLVVIAAVGVLSAPTIAAHARPDGDVALTGRAVGTARVAARAKHHADRTGLPDLTAWIAAVDGTPGSVGLTGLGVDPVSGRLGDPTRHASRAPPLHR
jgi:hypothetical protein